MSNDTGKKCPIPYLWQPQLGRVCFLLKEEKSNPAKSSKKKTYADEHRRVLAHQTAIVGEQFLKRTKDDILTRLAATFSRHNLLSS